MADTDDGDKTTASNLVITKYKAAADIVNKVLKTLVSNCHDGKTVLEICQEGDRLITEQTNQLFKKPEIKKGIAFPTCVSVNNCICHYSPLKSDSPIVLKDGDVVKIDLGAHIDGFIAVAAHTLVVGASLEKKVTGRKADVILAAYYAAETALRLVRPTGENYAVTDAIQRVAESFKCKPISGMLSHQLKQFRIDGDKSIILNPTEGQKKEHEKCEFELHEVYAVDVLISTGEGKGRELDNKQTTVYKKTDDVYSLKLKASRAFFSDVEKRFATMPFTLRALEDEKKAKMGVVECVNHKLLEAFNVLHEKDDEFVAQFKITVLLLPNGTMKITGLPVDLGVYQSEHKIVDEKIRQLLATAVSSKTKKKKAKKSGLKSGDAKENSAEKPTPADSKAPAAPAK